jgi:hypothetical protein
MTPKNWAHLSQLKNKREQQHELQNARFSAPQSRRQSARRDPLRLGHSCRGSVGQQTGTNADATQAIAMPFPVDNSQAQMSNRTFFSVARHRAEWGTRAGLCAGGEGTMLLTDDKTTN